MSMTNTPGKPRHIPLRKCVVCRNLFSKDRLFRFTDMHADGIVLTERAGVLGKGIYLCRDAQCVQTLLQDRRFKKKYQSRICGWERDYLNRLSGMENSDGKESACGKSG